MMTLILTRDKKLSKWVPTVVVVYRILHWIMSTYDFLLVAWLVFLGLVATKLQHIHSFQ
jgi:hypothetical protein